MAYTTIDKSTAQFNTKLYTGNASTLNVTGVGFQPDWVWIKSRGGAGSHNLFDAVRGVQKRIFTDLTSAEQTSATYLTAFGSDGFTLGNNGDVNGNNQTTVAWNWKANGAGSSNTDGSLASTVSVNSTARFSIVKYLGNGNAATIGHGLGVVPKMIILKNLNTSDSWYVYHQGMGANAYMHINTNNGALSPSTNQFQATTPTNSVFYVGNAEGTGGNGRNMIAYCFADVEGYSKFGKYTGNGSSSGDGSFIYTGFKPSFLMVKRTNGAKDWHIFDTARSTSNVVKSQLEPNTSNAETTSSNWVDMLSNGFKWRIASGDGEYGDVNGDGDTYIYMAIGQSLVGSNGVTAKAR